jgi:hypothetical protein
MATSKEIEIILQAKLEQGNAVDSAKSLGQGISDAIERAFDGLGERIASKLILDMQTTLSSIKLSDVLGNSTQQGQQLSYQAQPSFTGFSTTQSGVMVPDYMNSSYSSFGPHAPAPNTKIPESLSDAHQAASRSDSRILSSSGSNDSIPYRRSNFGLNYSYTSPFMGISGPLSGEMNDARGQANQENRIKMDEIATRFRAYDTLRKVDPDTRLEPEFKKELTDLRQFSIGQISQNGSEIGELISKLRELREEISSNSEEVRAARNKSESDRTESDRALISADDRLNSEKNEVFDQINARQNHSSNIARTVASVEGALSADEQIEQMNRIRKVRAFAGITGAVGLGMQAYGESDLVKSNAEAGRAQLQNANMRDYLSGNFENMIATQQLGGDEELQSRSLSNARWSAAGKMVAGLGTFALGAAFSPTSLTGVGGIVSAGAMAAGASTMYDSYRDYMQLDSNAASQAEQLKRNQIIKNQEAMTGVRSSVNQSIYSYQTSQALGSTEISEDLYGSLPAGKYGEGSAYRANQNSLRSTVVRSGLTNSAFDQLQANLYGSMGAVFPNVAPAEPGKEIEYNANGSPRTPMRSDSVFNETANLARLQAQGFNNAAQIAGVLFNDNTEGGGDTDRQRALKEAGAMYTEAVRAGMDQLKIPHYLEIMATRMASNGPGSEYAEAANSRRGLALAQEIYGPKIEGKQAEHVAEIYNGLMDMTKGDGAHAKYAALEQLKKTEKETGVKLNRTSDAWLLQKNDLDAKSFAELHNTFKGKNDKEWSEDDAKKVIDSYQGGIVNTYANDTMNWLPPEYKLLNLGSKLNIKSGKGLLGLKHVMDGTANEEAKYVPDLAASEQNLGPVLSGDQYAKTLEGLGAFKVNDKPLGKDAQNAIEGSKASMLSVGMNNMEEVLGLVNGQLSTFNSRLESLNNLLDKAQASSKPAVPSAKLDFGDDLYMRPGGVFRNTPSNSSLPSPSAVFIPTLGENPDHPQAKAK